MTFPRVKSLLLNTALAVSVATSVAAQDKRALVVAEDVDGRTAALQVSETLLGLGFDVQRMEAPSAADLAIAVGDLNDADGVTAVYFAGATARLLDFVAATQLPRFVFLDACLTGDLSDAPENVFVATQGEGCDASLSDVLLDRLTVPGLQTDQWQLDDDYQSVSTLQNAYVFRQPTSDVRLTADDYALLETLSPTARDRMISLWREAGIPVDIAGANAVAPVVAAVETVRVSPIRPVAPSAVIAPIAPRLVSGGVTRVTENVSVISNPVTPTISLPTAGADGLPTPSILVGFAVEELPDLPDAPQVPSDPLAGNTFGYEDRAAREVLRDEDAALFGGLVEAGAFDPPQDDLARALQLELQRINCYTSGVDGAWGAGSQRALAAYYAQLGEQAPGSDANVATFREIIARDDIRCPEPVAAPTPAAQPVAQARQTTQPAQSRRTTTSTPAPVATAPAAPAATTTGRRVINQTGGTGVFR